MKKELIQDFKVKLYPDQLKKLTKIADERRVSRSLLIREAIDIFTSKKK